MVVLSAEPGFPGRPFARDTPGMPQHDRRARHKFNVAIAEVDGMRGKRHHRRDGGSGKASRPGDAGPSDPYLNRIPRPS